MGDREVAAHHEAGHALSHYALGRGGNVKEAWIDSHGNGQTRLHGWRGYSDREVLQADLAGPVMECRHNGDRLRRAVNCCAHDRIRKLAGEDDLDEWGDRTRKLLRGQERNHAALTKALLERGRLSGSEIADVISGASRWG